MAVSVRHLTNSTFFVSLVDGATVEPWERHQSTHEELLSDDSLDDEDALLTH
jgi:hypothetical protein